MPGVAKSADATNLEVRSGQSLFVLPGNHALAHPGLDFVLIDRFSGISFLASACNSFANVDGVLHVLEARVVRDRLEELADLDVSPLPL
jgi:hypothetical protein